MGVWRQVEGTVPVYNVVTNSKAGLMQRAVQLNPFHTRFFIWLDAGMGHGKPGIFPAGQCVCVCACVCLFICVCVCA